MFAAMQQRTEDNNSMVHSLLLPFCVREVSGYTFKMITLCTQLKPATNSRKDRQRSALILNTGHSNRAYCCPKWAMKWHACHWDYHVICIFQWTVMKNVGCLFPMNKNSSLAKTGYKFWHNLFANMRLLHEMKMDVDPIITHMDDCLLP
jgi:hypothetical protein